MAYPALRAGLFSVVPAGLDAEWAVPTQTLKPYPSEMAVLIRTLECPAVAGTQVIAKPLKANVSDASLNKIFCPHRTDSRAGHTR